MWEGREHDLSFRGLLIKAEKLTHVCWLNNTKKQGLGERASRELEEGTTRLAGNPGNTGRQLGAVSGASPGAGALQSVILQGGRVQISSAEFSLGLG